MTDRFSALVIHEDCGPGWSSVVACHRADRRCNDRVFARRSGKFLVASVIDAVSSDTEADAATSSLLANLPPPELSSRGFSESFTSADLSLAGVEYEISAVSMVLDDRSVMGCSAGDCEAWFVPLDGAPVQITAEQNRRPRIGASVAPVEFEFVAPRPGLLIAASDGFWTNVARSAAFDLARELSREAPSGIARGLAFHVYERKARTLPEDVSVFVAAIG